MRKSIKICCGLVVASLAFSAVRMVVDPEYRTQVTNEQQARKDQEEQDKKAKLADCESTRNLTPNQWSNMSQLLQSLVSTECRPSFAPERTITELLNSSGRATQRTTKRVGEVIEETLNKPF